ncbi:MAG: hypothetical protein HFI10_01135 [Lachnospiraceae bacterium]|jgi:YD repeat-containing protein|nr:hypothetical protein [Lachnospiraceae bacterium]
MGRKIAGTWIKRTGEKIEGTIYGKYKEALKKIRLFFGNIRKKEPVDQFITDVRNKIDERHKESSWVDITVMITNILGFAAYCVISPVLAEYQREMGIRIFSFIAIGVIVIVIIWELVCLIGRNYLKCAGKILEGFGEGTASFFHKYFRPITTVVGLLFALFVIWIVSLAEWTGMAVIGLCGKIAGYFERHPSRKKWLPAFGVAVFLVGRLFTPEVACYGSVVEVYGMPTGIGEELGKEEMEKRAAYWKIEDYTYLHMMTLTYEEPYHQLEVMKQNSTAYNMLFFQPAARIEIKYNIDKSKYRSLNQNSFEKARENNYREPEKISYYDSSDKLILKLERNEYGKFDVVRYSSADAPRLLNSTLLYTKKERAGENDLTDGESEEAYHEEVSENSMTTRQIEVTYYEDGLIKTRRLSPYMYNANGINGEYYVYDENRRLKTLYYLDINGEFVCNKQGIMMVDFQYEDNGNLHSIRYYGGEDREEKTEGYQGVFCERFSYDLDGNLKERSQRDRNENLRSDDNGVCIYRYHYDEGRLVKEEFLGFDGEPVRDNYFQSNYVLFDMDDGGEMTELSVSIEAVGSSPTMAESSVSGFWAYVPGGTVFSEKDDAAYQAVSAKGYVLQEAEAALLSQTGRQNQASFEPADREQAGQVWDASENSKSTEEEQGSENKKNTEIHQEEKSDRIRNYETICYRINKNRRVHEKRYCDGNGRPVVRREGYAAIRYEYDKQGRIVAKRYYRDEKEPCRVKGGYAVVKNVYVSDENNDIASIKYLDMDGNSAVFNTMCGYAYVRYTRVPEDKNEIIYKEYFDEKNHPVCLPAGGYAMTEQYYDERNLLIWEAYYKERDNKPDRTFLGIDPEFSGADIRDEEERDKKYEKTCRTDYHVAEIWYEYEDSGNRIRELYKDETGQLVNRSDTGYAAVYWKYEGGKKTDCHYEGSRNQMLKAAVDKATGIAGTRYLYESGRVVREEYYDIQGEPSFRTDIGCAAQGFEYNDRGEVCTKFYYGLEGELVPRKDTGYAVAAYQDDEYGRTVSVRYYDAEKQPVISAEDHCAGYEYSYDEEGNREYIRYIGTDGELMIRRDLGYAQVRYDYDSNGNIVKGEYFDKEKGKNAKPLLRKERGYASYTSEYDENGNWLESCYYGLAGEPVLRQDEGYFRIINEYNDEGRVISQKFYDIHDAASMDDPDDGLLLVSTKYGCAGFLNDYVDKFDGDEKEDNIFEFEYEEDERVLKKITTYIGTDGEPVVRRDLGYAKVEIVYDMEGREVSAICYDTADTIAVRKEGGYAAFRDWYENGKWVKGEYYGADGMLISRNDAGYAVIENEYDEYGNRISEKYYDENYAPVISTKYHCAGFVSGYDEAGKKTHVHYLDTDGKMMMRRDLGYAQMTIGYDSVGNKVSESYFDTKGKPAVWKKGGYASYVDKYENARWTEGRYYDKKGRLTQRADEGYAVLKNKYDEYGQRITQSYYDASEELKPVVSTKYHCAGFQFEYDEWGNKVYAGYLGVDGNLMVRRDLGYAQAVMEYDEEGIGNKKREAYFDIFGKPAVDKEGGYSYYKNDYDEKGRLKSAEYYIIRNVRKQVDMAYEKTEGSVEDGREGIDRAREEGELVLRKDSGYARVEYDYDEWGQEERVFYTGTHGESVISTEYSCAGFVYKYDERGYRTDIFYLGQREGRGQETDVFYSGMEEEYIVRRDLGILHIQKAYDTQGNLVKEFYYASCPESDDDIPVSATYKKYGFAAYEEKFVNGRVVETKYLDAGGNPVIHGEKGYAIVRYEYDKYGQCTAEVYYGPDYEPIVSSEYYCAGKEYEYDERGNWTDGYYLGPDGDIIICRDLGYAHVSMERDECGNEVGVSYYDAEGNPVTWKKGGNTSAEFVYENGKCVERRYFDGQGNLKLRSDAGYAIIRYEYDEYGKQIGEDYYDTEGNPIFHKDYQCAGRRFGYDERENQTEFQCIGADGNPMMWKDLGYAQIRCEFDHFNNKIKEVYLDVGGMPVVREELGYAQTKWEYDKLGRMSKESYFNAADEPVMRKEGGYAYCKFSYSEEEHQKEIWYYDLENELTIRNDTGYAYVIYKYDAFGQKTGEFYWNYDKDWIRALNPENDCTGISYYYEENGDNTYIWYWGENGKVAECKDSGIAEVFMVYDVYGHEIKREYRKNDPKGGDTRILEIHKELGYAKVEYTYENNYWTETKYYDEDDKYIVPKGEGYAIYRRRYNELGQLRRETYYDENDEPTNYLDGKNAAVEYSYNSYGYIEKREYKSKDEVAAAVPAIVKIGTNADSSPDPDKTPSALHR